LFISNSSPIVDEIVRLSAIELRVALTNSVKCKPLVSKLLHR